MDYYIIIPAHNEEAFLEGALNTILSQTLAPKKVILVNDNSTDSTEAIMDKFIEKASFFNKLNTTSSTEHMPGSKVINAFNKGLNLLDDNFDFIVKLDADILLPDNYFETIATTFKLNKNAGVVGGFIYEKNKKGEWKLNHPMNKDHVRGAFKAYSKKCFKSIGGLKNAMGWDTVDELLVQYHGYKIVTLDNLHVKHLRPIGGAYNKKAKLLQGKAMYTMRYGYLITLIASIKMAVKQGKTNAFFDNMNGFKKAKKEKALYLVTPEEGQYIRNLRWKGIKKQIF
ncbi:glycosyltransferase family 2 protein [Cellulophaga baltica]|uniref:glycosyltransferase n=1 Tax=Cellulophaga TaxID=104264 RepID=UPI001C06E38B|nr:MULTISPECIES: glycosyltransferase family A protein [Cellulophaga]MBU2997162.1 glycosyltransferase family 2 protein [Cellulophaga baltica]MDO6768560.1 glycosyltransferase family A protein [Cellulophaga sp. 1_MG-2023]